MDISLFLHKVEVLTFEMLEQFEDNTSDAYLIFSWNRNHTQRYY